MLGGGAQKIAQDLPGNGDFRRDLAAAPLVDLPGVGDQIRAHERFGDIESVKTVSELFAPVSGATAGETEDGYYRGFVGKFSSTTPTAAWSRPSRSAPRSSS